MFSMGDEKTPSFEARLLRLEAEVRGMRKFSTELEIGHEARARRWNRRIATLESDVRDLKDLVKKTRKKVKKLKP
jgi:hypothetical protein